MQYFSEDQLEKIRRGYYSAVYFNRTKEILLAQKNFKSVTMQVFQKNEGSTLCGVEEVVELIRLATGIFEKGTWINKFNELKIESLKDGDTICTGEPVMHISGPYVYFAHLESIYLGILARRTLVASNVKRAVQSAGKKPVIFFADRFDYFQNQTGDGMSAKVGGATAVCTDAMSTGFGKDPVGTIPHALISIYGGNTVEAAKQFSHQFPNIPLIVLVDFENDCVKTALEAAKTLGKKLWGVRIDTAENLADKSIKDNVILVRSETTTPESDSGQARMTNLLNGVNPVLVRNVRKALDSQGFDRVKIVVSGGFDAPKIARFEKENTPVDVYGVGSTLLKGNNDFTADVVKVEGKLMSKAGRDFVQNSRLQMLKMEE